MTQWLQPWRLCTPRCAQSSSLRHPGQAMTTLVAWWQRWVIPLDLLTCSVPHMGPLTTSVVSAVLYKQSSLLSGGGKRGDATP